MRTRPPMRATSDGVSTMVLPDADSLAQSAAAVIVEEARRAVEERGTFSIALAGGSTPRPVYRLLASPPLSEEVPWADTSIFWGDERCVGPHDPRSNQRMARETLLDHVPVLRRRVHPMQCGAEPGAGMTSEAAAQRAARDYEELLRSVFTDGGMDLVLLGLGADAHTASLFPHSPALDERERWAVAALDAREVAGAADGAGEPLWRVTLTAPFLNRARSVLFIVSGADKAVAAGRVLGGRGDFHELPARLIRPNSGRLWWLLDEAAASLSDTVDELHRKG